jgi:hypothetical protein
VVDSVTLVTDVIDEKVAMNREIDRSLVCLFPGRPCVLL